MAVSCDLRSGLRAIFVEMAFGSDAGAVVPVLDVGAPVLGVVVLVVVVDGFLSDATVAGFPFPEGAVLAFSAFAPDIFGDPLVVDVPLAFGLFIAPFATCTSAFGPLAAIGATEVIVANVTANIVTNGSKRLIGFLRRLHISKEVPDAWAGATAMRAATYVCVADRNT